MFSVGHLLFIIISTVLIITGVLLCGKLQPPVRGMFLVCLCIGLFSEFTKILGSIEIVPVVEPVIENGALIYRETGAYAPYLEAEHLPFELCSFQIFFMFLALIIRHPVWSRRLYAFMYITCIIGGGMAVLFSSAAPGLSSIRDFVTSVDVWRAFLYHSMLIVMGIYIGMSKECNIRFRDLPWSMLFLVLLDCMSFYMNSMMSTPYYSGDKLIGIGNAVNYFSSYNNPLGIVMADKKQWFIYLLIRIVLAMLLITLVQLPLLFKKGNHKNEAR